MTTLFLDAQPLTLDNGIVGEPWVVASANPATFFEAISEEPADRQDIHAQLFMPNTPQRPGVVIIAPGSLGIAPSHVYKAELLTSAGIAACLIDPFGARQVSSTVANQAQFSFAASAWDVLAAAQTLTAQDRFARVGLQGHSRGGTAIQLAASMYHFTGHQLDCAGVYAAYPWCGFQFLNPAVGDTLVRSIIGDQDEWCSVQQVQAYTHSLAVRGCEATCHIVAGAHHSFDRDTAIEWVAEASVAPGAPTIYIDDNGICIHPVNGPCPAQTTERELMLYGIKAGFGKRGAHIGTAENYATLFHQDMMAFWRQTFAANLPTED